jgi:tetratricopeptide (TPR) repeat protein
MQSAVVRVFLGLALLSGFTFLTYRAESAYFADRFSKIPLFGTELAIQTQPQDPQYEFQLGNYWMIGAQQPATALLHFVRATRLNPYSGRYWGQLAIAYQQTGDSQRATESILRSLTADPTTPDLLWQAANVYSFLGEKDKAIDAIHRFVLASPDQIPIAAQLGWRATRDANLLLDRVLPKGPNSDLSLLIALVRMQDPEASARIQTLDVDPKNFFVHNLASLAVPQPSNVDANAQATVDLAAEREKARANMLKLIAIKSGRDWTKTESELIKEHQARVDETYRQKQADKADKLADGAEAFTAAVLACKRLMAEPENFDIRFALPYIQMLVDTDQDRAAEDAWASAVNRETRLKNWSTGNNLIKNSSFEYELLNGGLDWQYTPSEATDLAIDHHTSKDGGSSLLMRFKDKPMADVGIVQYVPVRPATAYDFSGFLKTDSVEGATGVRFQVQDTDAGEPYFESADVKGTANWTKLTGRFTTRPSAHFVAIRVIRNPANTLIKGQAWADALNLVEAGAK